MSQRSIIEINHDQCGAFNNDADAILFCQLLRRAVGSGSDEAWEPLRRFGIRRVIQVHHSATRKVVIGGVGWEKEYPVP